MANINGLAGRTTSGRRCRDKQARFSVAVQVSVGVEGGVVFGQAEAGGQQSVVQEGHLVVSVNVAVEQDEGWRLLCAGEGDQQEQ